MATSKNAYPYEIEYKGKIIRCRTLDHVRDMLEELDGSKLIREATPWTVEEFKKFTGRIHIAQRRLLACLWREHGTAWVADSRLRDVLGLRDNQALAGVLSGITKVALMFDIEPRRIYTQTTTFKQGKPQRHYQIASSFLRAAAKHHWPSEEDLKED